MSKSMTGYGKATAEVTGRRFTIEVRSLNSKQLDLLIKLPAAYRPLEYDIRSRAVAHIERGKCDIYMNVEQVADSVVNINTELFRAYQSAIAELIGVAELDGAVAAAILRLPDVVSGESTAISDDEREAVFAALSDAITDFEKFRVQEGEVLIADLLRRVELIEQLQREIIPFEAHRMEAVRARILDGIVSLGLECDKNRLEQELMFYIEKLDITEEKVRLESHCRYFREVATAETNAGRKLGFIAQEMGREINTLGSKANDSDIQRIVVRMKDELEKIKEQVLNLL